MLKYTFIILAIAATGCSVGPIHVTHVDGNLPKMYVDSGYSQCKFRAKINVGDQNVDYNCVWKI